MPSSVDVDTEAAAARATAGDATGKATVATCGDYKPANKTGGARLNAIRHVHPG